MSDSHEWNVPDLLQLSGGYWGACALHAGVKLDVFSAIAESPLTAEQVAQNISGDVRAVAMLLDSLTALGLLAKSDGVYATTPFSAAHLSRSSLTYMGHIIMHHHHLVEGWSRLSEAVVSGAPVRKSVSHDAAETVRESFLMGMFNLACLLAPRITQVIDLSNFSRLLDLGGGPGTYAIHFCLANPRLTAKIYDLSTTKCFAETTVARFDLSDRIDFVSGDYNAEPLPAGFDVAWLSHVLHADGPEACKKLLSKAVAALNPGGLLLVQEFILNDEKSGPPFPALFSLNMLIGTENGQSYSQNELFIMMKDAGLSEILRLPLELPNGAGILSGRKL
jgi:SAM-dependent methyltransferase